ncbi:MAG: chemotaxis protein CheW [Acidimicrobiales bacterium]
MQTDQIIRTSAPPAEAGPAGSSPSGSATAANAPSTTTAAATAAPPASAAARVPGNAVADAVSIEATAATNQFLTFVLGDEEYGVDILRVQEIKGWERATAIPNTPDYICGVMNLRGAVVPVVDLRRRFALDSTDYLSTTVVIVVKVEGDGMRTMGFVVDAVSDVYNVATEHIQPAPDFGARVDTKYIRGLAVVDDKLVILLDLDRLIGLDAAFAAADAAAEQRIYESGVAG